MSHLTPYNYSHIRKEESSIKKNHSLGRIRVKKSKNKTKKEEEKSKKKKLKKEKR